MNSGCRRRLLLTGRIAVWLTIVGSAASVPLTAFLLTAQRGQDRPPLSPSAALTRFVVEPGYRINLVAAEPLVQSPVAIAFDDRGRMYVAENRGYPDPLENEPAAKPEGVIAGRYVD